MMAVVVETVVTISDLDLIAGDQDSRDGKASMTAIGCSQCL